MFPWMKTGVMSRTGTSLEAQAHVSRVCVLMEPTTGPTVASHPDSSAVAFPAVLTRLETWRQNQKQNISYRPSAGGEKHLDAT